MLTRSSFLSLATHAGQTALASGTGSRLLHINLHPFLETFPALGQRLLHPLRVYPGDIAGCLVPFCSIHLLVEVLRHFKKVGDAAACRIIEKAELSVVSLPAAYLELGGAHLGTKPFHNTLVGIQVIEEAGSYVLRGIF